MNFHILLVEDDEAAAETTVRLIKRTASEITAEKILIEVARTVEEVEDLLDGAAQRSYRLILLDMRVPKGGEVGYYGTEKLLPKLRSRFPTAAIVILTAFAYEDHLNRAVGALLNDLADDFIPKDVPWGAIVPRLKGALKHSADRSALRIAAAAGRSNIGRTTAEDIVAAMSRWRGVFANAAEELSGLHSPQAESLSARIRSAFDSLASEMSALVSRFEDPGMQELAQIELPAMVDELSARFDPQLRSHAGRLSILRPPVQVVVSTYASDLRTALCEVLQNGVDAALQSLDDSASPQVTISIAPIASGAEICVTDTGPGFSPAAIDTLFQPESSHWQDPDGRCHAGMGLYVARRMMTSIGGDIRVENRDGHAEVRISIRDWGQVS